MQNNHHYARHRSFEHRSENACEGPYGIPMSQFINMKLAAQSKTTNQLTVLPPSTPYFSSTALFAPSYELSDDIAHLKVQHLEKKYGGRHRTHQAAIIIQRFYRRYKQQQLYEHKRKGPKAMHASRSDRQIYPRNLALSQPSLRYQPAISLRNQLRVEQDAEINMANHDVVNTSDSPKFNFSDANRRSPPSPRPMEHSPATPRSYVDLMSPRISTRRIVVPSNDRRQDLHENYEPDFPKPVASGTTPSVWVRNVQFIEDQPKNNHVVAHHSNSLSRIERRTHSVGPERATPASLQHNNPGNRLAHINNQAPSLMGRDFDMKNRRTYRICLNYFNKKPDRGLQLLFYFGYVQDDPISITKFFRSRRGLSKEMIGEFLGTLNSPYHEQILECFLMSINLTHLDIDQALRYMLHHFRLPKEAQKIDHILEAFGKKYMSDARDTAPPYLNDELVYVIAYAIMMLNVDLHTKSVKNSQRMKCDEFINSIKQCKGGDAVCPYMLRDIYERVKEKEFQSSPDHVSQLYDLDKTIMGKEKPVIVENHRRLICYCRLHQVFDTEKRQSPSAHQREIFLFNDMIIIAKIFSRKKNNTLYTLKTWCYLNELKVNTFRNNYYQHGIQFHLPNDNNLFFNAKSGEDRAKFMDDLTESQLEVKEMDEMRNFLAHIEPSKALKPNSFALQGNPVGSRLARNDIQRDSGLPEIDPNSPVTLGTSSFLYENGLNHIGHTSEEATPVHQSINMYGDSTASTGSSSTNGTPAPLIRRLSFHSCDSGVMDGIPFQLHS